MEMLTQAVGSTSPYQKGYIRWELQESRNNYCSTMSNDSDDESTSSVDEGNKSMSNRQIEELFNAAVTLEQKESEETKLK